MPLVPNLGPELGAGLQADREELQVSRPRPAPVPAPAPLAAPAHQQHADRAGPPARDRDVLGLRDAGHGAAAEQLGRAAPGAPARSAGSRCGGTGSQRGGNMYRMHTLCCWHTMLYIPFLILCLVLRTTRSRPGLQQCLIHRCPLGHTVGAGGHGVAGGEQEAEVRGGGGGLVVVGEVAAVVPPPAQGAALLQPRHPRHGGQEAGPRHPALQPGAGAGHGGGEAGWRH